MDLASWIKIIKELITEVGFPIVAYGALGYGVWLVISWLGSQLVIPFRDRGFSFLTTLVDQLKQQTSSLQSIEDKTSETASTLKAIRENGCGAFGNKCVNWVPSHNGEESKRKGIDDVT